MLHGSELTHVLYTVCTGTNAKRKALSAFEKLAIIKKVDNQQCVMSTKVAEELRIPGSTNNMMNKENMLLQWAPNSAGQEKTKNFYI
jgi:F420-dependent methylenetetrahydromethanopterin dehydrogenase